MTIGMTEFVVLVTIWTGTVVALAVLAARDARRRRRQQWRRHIEFFNGRP